MLPVNVWILLAGLAMLLGLKWYRNRFRAWPNSPVDSFTVGYFLPALGVSLVLMGIGGFAERSGRITDNPLNLILNGVLAAGVLMLLLALATIFGVRLPRVFLPRWLRAERDGDARGGALAEAPPGLVLVDRPHRVTLTLPGSADRWVVRRKLPPGTLIEARARRLPPSGYRPVVRVTIEPSVLAPAGRGGASAASAGVEPARIAGREAVRRTHRHSVRGVEVVTWAWTTPPDQPTLTLAISCAATEAAPQAALAERIAATLAWEPTTDPTTGPTA